jgi:hypothetical protein
MGSGIYTPFAQSTVYAYSVQKVSRIVVSDLVSPPRASFDPRPNQAVIPPLNDADEVVEETHGMIYDDFAEFNVTFLDIAAAMAGNVTVCDVDDDAGEICCSLTYAFDEGPEAAGAGPVTYALGAFSGKVVIQNQYSWLAQSCVLVSCSSPPDVSSCGRPVTGNDINVASGTRVTFELKTEVSTGYVYPSAINFEYDLLVPKEIEYLTQNESKTTGRSVVAAIRTRDAVQNLAYAGIYARLYPSYS